MKCEGTMERVYILLHTCCAPCATASVERLRGSGRIPVLFYSNSNIYPAEEYEKRLEETQKYANRQELQLYIDEYDHAAWLEFISIVPEFEKQPEGSARCGRCFTYSFQRTAAQARDLGIPAFTTTLSISPYKKSRQLFDVGALFPGFTPIDFKKQDGYKRSIELSREYGLYRQTYCGCEFSLREKP